MIDGWVDDDSGWGGVWQAKRWQGMGVLVSARHGVSHIDQGSGTALLGVSH
jgi:hypothetical protein